MLYEVGVDADWLVAVETEEADSEVAVDALSLLVELDELLVTDVLLSELVELEEPELSDLDEDDSVDTLDWLLLVLLDVRLESVRLDEWLLSVLLLEDDPEDKDRELPDDSEDAEKPLVDELEFVERLECEECEDELELDDVLSLSLELELEDELEDDCIFSIAPSPTSFPATPFAIETVAFSIRNRYWPPGCSINSFCSLYRA